MGARPTLTVAIPFLLPIRDNFGVGLSQFLFVIGLDAGQLGYSLKTDGNDLPRVQFAPGPYDAQLGDVGTQRHTNGSRNATTVSSGA